MRLQQKQKPGEGKGECGVKMPWGKRIRLELGTEFS
jgi:hypothetical protein